MPITDWISLRLIDTLSDPDATNQRETLVRRLDVRLFDHLRPLDDVRGDHRVKFLGSAAYDVEAV